MFCVSVLSYVSQICFVPAEVVKQEKYALQMLTAGPWNTFTHAFLVQMDRCGFAAAFTDLRSMNYVCMLRTATCNSNSFSECLARLRSRPMNNEASLLPVLHRWHKSALVLQIAKAVDQYGPLGAQTAGDMLSLKEPFDPRVLLHKRLSRWVDADLQQIALSDIVERAMEVISDLHGQVPYCVLAALWRSWLNGWCTSKRFQEDCGPCAYWMLIVAARTAWSIMRVAQLAGDICTKEHLGTKGMRPYLGSCCWMAARRTFVHSRPYMFMLFMGQ